MIHTNFEAAVTAKNYAGFKILTFSPSKRVRLPIHWTLAKTQDPWIGDKGLHHLQPAGGVRPPPPVSRVPRR